MGAEEISRLPVPVVQAWFLTAAVHKEEQKTSLVINNPRLCTSCCTTAVSCDLNVPLKMWPHVPLQYLQRLKDTKWFLHCARLLNHTTGEICLASLSTSLKDIFEEMNVCQSHKPKLRLLSNEEHLFRGTLRIRACFAAAATRAKSF